MSARVFNSRVGELGRAMRPSAAVAAPEPCSQAVDRVRRNLFGPVDPEESRRILERELALINRRDEELYEFDFVRERPLAGPARRFPWERVQPGGVPESYALRCLAFLGVQPAPAPAPAAAASASTASAPAAPAPAALPPCTPAPARTRRQAHIHEFMRSRKRPQSSSAKDDVKAAHPSKNDAPTPKRRRAAAPAPAAATASASAATAAASQS